MRCLGPDILLTEIVFSHSKSTLSPLSCISDEQTVRTKGYLVVQISYFLGPLTDKVLGNVKVKVYVFACLTNWETYHFPNFFRFHI